MNLGEWLGQTDQHRTPVGGCRDAQPLQHSRSHGAAEPVPGAPLGDGLWPRDPA